MYRVVASAFVLLIFLCSGAQAETCKAGGYPIAIPTGYDHDKWVKAQQPSDIRFEFDGYTSVFYGPNRRVGNPTISTHPGHPYWVSHEVRSYKKHGAFVYAAGFDRPSPWYESQQLSFLGSQQNVTDRKVDESYAGEALVWNRGHMATRNLVNRISAEAGCNSHTFANAVPQYWSLNQGDWLALENAVGALSNKHGKAWAISGPIYYGGVDVETIGRQGEIKVSIPHALFKVIVIETNQGKEVRAFVFAQPSYRKVKSIMAANGGRKPSMGFRSCRKTDQSAYDFQPNAVKLTEIEQLTGLSFFPDASVPEKTGLNNMSNKGLWTIDLNYFERPCGSDEDED